jgi:predicted nicotinamide N-methyase
MTGPSPARLRAFVRRSTVLQPVPDVPGLRLHRADDITALWHATGRELGLADPPLPYWAFAWSGGLGIARHLLAHPALVRDRRVLDVGTGSGLCAIVAARLGAASIVAVDVDPIASAAAGLNARANDVRIAVRRLDLLAAAPPDVDVLLAGDVCYEETMAGRMVAWLRSAADRGSTVLLGDPGRAYAPRDLIRLGTYRVQASLEIEEATDKASAVFGIGPGVDSGIAST